LVHFSLNDSALHIPNEYVWETKGQSFTTHNYASRLLIKTNNGANFSTLINKSSIRDELEGNNKLAEFGQLSNPTLDFDPNANTIEIRHSFSFPITDIGIGVEKQ
jgi:hypothetical protein